MEEGEGGDGGVKTDSDEAEAWIEDMSGEPSGQANDEGQPVVSVAAPPPPSSPPPPPTLSVCQHVCVDVCVCECVHMCVCPSAPAGCVGAW